MGPEKFLFFQLDILFSSMRMSYEGGEGRSIPLTPVKQINITLPKADTIKHLREEKRNQKDIKTNQVINVESERRIVDNTQ